MEDCPAQKGDAAAVLSMLRQLDEYVLDPCADLSQILTRAAAIFGCTVGAHTPATGVITVSPDGVVGRSGNAAHASRRVVGEVEVWLSGDSTNVGLLDTGVATQSWSDVDIAGESAAADLLARLATAVLVVQSRSSSPTETADLHALLSGAGVADHGKVARRLGFGPRSLVCLMALFGPSEAVDEVVAQVRAAGATVHRATVDGVQLVIASPFDGVELLRLPVGLRCGFVPPTSVARVPEVWRRTVHALRFALPSEHDDRPPFSSESVAVNAEDLGAYEILAAELSLDKLARVADLRRLDELCRQAGPDMLRTLLAVASTDSLRQAARTLHLHHNSVGHRLERAEKILGFSFTEPYGRARLLLILTLHRLRDSHTLF